MKKIINPETRSKTKKKSEKRVQGRDLNILRSLEGTGQKMVEKIVPDKKRKPAKHKKELFPEEEI